MTDTTATTATTATAPQAGLREAPPAEERLTLRKSAKLRHRTLVGNLFDKGVLPGVQPEVRRRW